MTEKRKEYLRNYCREYRKNHPERVQASRALQYANYLRRLGYTVIVPEQAEVKK